MSTADTIARLVESRRTAAVIPDPPPLTQGAPALPPRSGNTTGLSPPSPPLSAAWPSPGHSCGPAEMLMRTTFASAGAARRNASATADWVGTHAPGETLASNEAVLQVPVSHTAHPGLSVPRSPVLPPLLPWILPLLLSLLLHLSSSASTDNVGDRMACLCYWQSRVTTGIGKEDVR